jgi:hypothetical protein
LNERNFVCNSKESRQKNSGQSSRNLAHAFTVGYAMEQRSVVNLHGIELINGSRQFIN